MSDLKKKGKTLRQLVENAIQASYEIGYSHGGNRDRMLRGEPPQRDNQGWGTVADRLIRQVRLRKEADRE